MIAHLKQAIPLALLLIAIPIGYYASRCGIYPSCPFHPQLDGLSFTLFKPLWVFSLYGLGGVVLLPFVRRRVFKIWASFAVAWLVITLFAVVLAPLEINSWLTLVSYVKEDVARWMGISFSFISICIILITSLIPYKGSKRNS